MAKKRNTGLGNRKRKRRGWSGNTIPVAAKKLQMGESQLRRAVDRKEVAYVEFAGLKRITDAEIERVANLLGLHVVELEEGQAA
jgi:hypothetical protein